MTRPLPHWFDEAKVGVFIHWGVYSVPAFGSEWYWWDLDGDIAVPDKEARAVRAFHNKTYHNLQYTDFAPLFRAELFDATQWADMFRKAGIKYVVLTSKHHEGFANWCSAEAWNWNACDVGPKRDLVGELTDAVRAAGLRMGLYHSIFEWFHPLWLADKAANLTTSRYVDEVYLPQAKDLNMKYKPDLIWSDGDWEANSSFWKSPELLAWLYNDSPNKNDVIVNDRWGSDNPPIGSGHHFGGYFSGGDRQQASSKMLTHKWENAFTIDSLSWGYARNDNLSIYLNISTILYELVSTVAYGGNVLINIGPAKDGTIPTIFQERLQELGLWLEVNGEAIYGTKMWREHNDTAYHGIGHGVFYTAKYSQNSELHDGGALYAIMLDWPANNSLHLRMPEPADSAAYSDRVVKIQLLGLDQLIVWRWSRNSTGIILTLPTLTVAQLPSLLGPWVFRIEGVK